MKVATTVSFLILSLGAGVASAEGPVNYPDMPELISTKTRAEVNAEVLEARRLGLLWNGEIEVLAAHTSGPSKSRAQVIAETREAARLGLMIPVGERDAPVATPEQERMIAKAGESVADVSGN